MKHTKGRQGEGEREIVDHQKGARAHGQQMREMRLVTNAWVSIHPCVRQLMQIFNCLVFCPVCCDSQCRWARKPAIRKRYISTQQQLPKLLQKCSKPYGSWRPAISDGASVQYANYTTVPKYIAPDPSRALLLPRGVMACTWEKGKKTSKRNNEEMASGPRAAKRQTDATGASVFLLLQQHRRHPKQSPRLANCQRRNRHFGCIQNRTNM